MIEILYFCQIFQSSILSVCGFILTIYYKRDCAKSTEYCKCKNYCDNFIIANVANELESQRKLASRHFITYVNETLWNRNNLAQIKSKIIIRRTTETLDSK